MRDVPLVVHIKKDKEKWNRFSTNQLNSTGRVAFQRRRSSPPGKIVDD